MEKVEKKPPGWSGSMVGMGEGCLGHAHGLLSVCLSVGLEWYGGEPRWWQARDRKYGSRVYRPVGPLVGRGRLMACGPAAVIYLSRYGGTVCTKHLGMYVCTSQETAGQSCARWRPGRGVGEARARAVMSWTSDSETEVLHTLILSPVHHPPSIFARPPKALKSWCPRQQPP